MTDHLDLAGEAEEMGMKHFSPSERQLYLSLAFALREQVEEVKRKDEALKFYADRDQYERDRDGRMPILEDAGRTAYDALSPTTEAET